MKRIEEPTLADLFIASTFNVKKQTGRTRRAMAEVMMAYRQDMRKAHIFTLTDSFVEMATRLSIVPPEKTLARLQYATLPYDMTWIEFNLHAKMRALHEVRGHKSYVPEDVSPRLGLFLRRIDDTAALCTLVSTIDGTVLPHVTCYFFSTVEQEFTRAFGCDPLDVNLDTTHGGDISARMLMWGYEGEKAAAHLTRHGQLGFSRMLPAITALMDEDRWSDERRTRLFATEIREFTGTMRWLVTVLAMLNEVPIAADRIERTGHIRTGLTSRHNLLDYHRVALKLPKSDPVKYFSRKLSYADIQKRRAHEVRQHWRTYLHADKKCRPDEHDWVYDEEHGYALCGKCMGYRRRIPEHIRGDVRLGWVRKTYVMETIKE